MIGKLNVARNQNGDSWTPTSISNCIVWLRGDLGITLNGSTVSAWADQSGNANNYSQGTAANQPLYTSADTKCNNQSTVQDPNGANGRTMTSGNWTGGWSYPYSMYWVCYMDAALTSADIFTGPAGANSIRSFVTASGAGQGIRLIGISNQTISVTNNQKTVPSAFGMTVQNAGVCNFYANKSQIIAATTTSTSQTIPTKVDLLNGSTTLNKGGALAELIVYTGVHTAAQRDAVFTYFDLRYNLGG